MCGIVGYINKHRNIDNKSIIEQMVSMINHRGPDDNGIEILDVFKNSPLMAMGFTRLSILDTSLKGHQPMFDSDRSVCISLNGEIYNAFDYKNDLIAKGYTLRGHSDTEIILYLYKEYGIEGLLKRINGMYAICIADMIQHKVFLIRDRIGVKPLYYYVNNKVILYSSEYKTFYCHPEFAHELNKDALVEQFMFRYVAGRETLIKDVCNVLPGHYLVIDNDFNVESHKYWDEQSEYSSENRITLDEYENLISKSIKDRLISDVPLGVQLSGGIDSSLVLNYASELKGEPLETFSIVFDEQKYSEETWINQAASKCNAIQHKYIFNGDDFNEYFEKATWHLDEPLNHPNSGALMLLCQKAKQDVSVLLTGEGADELFGGYGRYSVLLRRYKYPLLSWGADKVRGRTQYYKTFEDRAIANSMWVMPDEIVQIFNESDIESGMNRRRQIWEDLDGGDTMQHFLNYDMKTYLVDILNRQDKMSMAYSIETRTPFLNYKLVEAVRTQNPLSYVKPCLRDSMPYTKIPLKKIAEKKFGKEFAYRQKSGFPLPLMTFFNDSHFVQRVEDSILPYLKQFDFLNYNHILSMWDSRNEISEYELEHELWVCLAFGEWGILFL